MICSVFRLSQKSFQIYRRKYALPYFHFDPILDLLQTSLLFLINIQWCLFLLMLFFYILNVFYPFKLSAFFQEFLIFEVEFCICLFECFKFILIILTLFSVKPLNFVNFLQEFVYKFTHFRLQILLIYKKTLFKTLIYCVGRSFLRNERKMCFR
jgi:hypothetical protein